MRPLLIPVHGYFPGQSRSCVRLASQAFCFGQVYNKKQHPPLSRTNHGGQCQLNWMFWPNNSKTRLVNRPSEEKDAVQRRQHPQCAMAIDRMEVTEAEIHEEKERIEEEEMFIGKEELPEVREDADEAGPTVGQVAVEMRECWDLWQNIGLPVEKIAKQRHMTETGVFFCIFNCIQKNYTVDWYELCKEAQFTSVIADRMIQATENFVSDAKGAPVGTYILREHLPPDVSEIHFGLYVTMLGRGLPYETIKEISFHPGGRKPEMEWGDVYADEERFPVDVTESTLLQWFLKKDGASMIEIALKFRECDDLELMRLLLKLEESGKIFWRQGIFRVLQVP